jgi:hypothetical protein
VLKLAVFFGVNVVNMPAVGTLCHKLPFIGANGKEENVIIGMIAGNLRSIAATAVFAGKILHFLASAFEQFISVY